jgi:toxin CptA
MLRLGFKPSRQLTTYLVLGHFIAATCALSVSLLPWLKLLLLSLLLMSLLYSLRNQVWRTWPFSIVALQFEHDGTVFMQYRNGKLLEAQVLGSSFVAPYLTIILLKTNQAWFARSVVVLPDMLAPDLFRSLRVWLKWRLGRGAAPKASVDWTGQS